MRSAPKGRVTQTSNSPFPALLLLHWRWGPTASARFADASAAPRHGRRRSRVSYLPYLPYPATYPYPPSIRN